MVHNVENEVEKFKEAIEKLREAIETNNQLNIYAEFCNLLKGIVEAAWTHTKGLPDESISRAIEMHTELKARLESLYEKIMDGSKEETLLSIEKVIDLSTEIFS